MLVMIEPQAEIDQLRAFGHDLGPSAKSGQDMVDVAGLALDWDGRVLAGEQPRPGDRAMGSVPIVGDDGDSHCPCLVRAFAAGVGSR